MTLGDAIRKMTDYELCGFLINFQGQTMIHTAKTFGIEIEEKIIQNVQEMYEKTLKELKSEI
jgi:hypothetical protein